MTPPPLPPVSAALEAFRASQASREAEQVISGNDLTSLNKFLQWSAAHSAPPEEQSEGRAKALAKSSDQLAADREWLDAAFPDMFADVKRLVTLLTEDKQPLSTEETVVALEGLEEYFADLNYAVNIDKLGALTPILHNAKAQQPAVRVAALWALGTAMKDLEEVKNIVVEKGGISVLHDALADEDAKVRAKAVMASSALLRHAKDDIKQKFDQAGGTKALRGLLADEDVTVSRRARFFLQHAQHTGNDDFVQGVLADRVAVAALAKALAGLNVGDVADVEAAVGAMKVLAERDGMGLLQVAPEIPGVVDQLSVDCSDEQLKEMLSGLAELLG